VVERLRGTVLPANACPWLVFGSRNVAVPSGVKAAVRLGRGPQPSNDHGPISRQLEPYRERPIVAENIRASTSALLGGLENLLPVADVNPLPELESDLPKLRHLLEAEFLMERHTRLVRQSDAADRDVHAPRLQYGK
jgi:hypothetical protein